MAKLMQHEINAKDKYVLTATENLHRENCRKKA